MAITTTDLLLVNRAGTDYKMASNLAMTKVQSTDVLLINRAGVDYKISGANFLAGTFQDTDLFLVNRGGVDYKATGALIRTILQRAPAFGTVVLAEEDTAGAAFTSQKFKTTITLTDAGQPAATIGLKATVVAGGVTKYLVFNAAGTVTDMQSADPGFVTMTNATAPELTFPATFPSGNAPDVELPNGTTITTVVEAKNTAGTVTKTSNVVTPARVFLPGDSVGGGYYIGKIKDGGVWYYLTLADVEETRSTREFQWATTTTLPVTPDQAMRFSKTNGPGIMANYMANNASTWPAFKYYYKKVIAGHDDWYIPAVNEAELIFRDLKRDKQPSNPGTPQITQVNNDSDPVGFMYTTTSPTTCTNPAFQYPAGSQYLGKARTGNPGGSPSHVDWISATLNQASPAQYVVQDMDYSTQKGQSVDTQGDAGFFRPVRRFPV